MALRISCIILYGGDPDNRRIDSVGGLDWMLSEDLIIEEIEAGANYYVEVGRERVAVIVAKQDGRKYLRTDPDKTAENNLLALPHYS